MKDEIKEILEELRKTADNTVFAVCSSKEELDKIPRYTANFMSINDRKAKQLLDYITNLQQEKEHISKVRDEIIEKYNELQQEKKDYKFRCEKALKDIDLLLNGTYSKQSGEVVMSYMKSDCCNLRLEIIKQDLQNGSDSQ